jgi:hypothetical protein
LSGFQAGPSPDSLLPLPKTASPSKAVPSPSLSPRYPFSSFQLTRLATASRAICIQAVKLRVYLGMSTVFEECFHLDAAETIICFETKGQFTLVQMLAVSETSLVLAICINDFNRLRTFLSC